MDGAGARRAWAGPPVVWAAGRLVLLLFVFKVFVFPGPDVTSDVSVIYQGWFGVLRQGTFPLADVAWQYPPAAALPILAPGLLPFLSYPHAFYVLVLLADAAVFALLAYAGRRPGKSMRGLWMWVIGVPLLGPTVYARYDVMVTAVAVAALLAGARHPRIMGALAGFGALLKVWPVLLLVGPVRRRAWASAAVTGAVLAAGFAAVMPGAFSFLTYQSNRGTEVESLGALVFHVARHFGWSGQVLLNYGSVEFLGPGVSLVSTIALTLTGAAFGWLLLWRMLAVRFAAHSLADAAFTAVLLFTVTSRVISPQYLVWLIGTAAVCLCFRGTRMGPPALLVLLAAPVTMLEFPLWFGDVVASDGLGLTLMFLRNGLLVAAAVTAAVRLWRATVPAAPRTGIPAQATDTEETPVSST
ncbi:glycosyltransferase family 87 protein [Streptomyces mangrovisoli]|uniref:DUF2029 domain-containing protein n=1 Tax=Streptomyces mangrovisoli TaxID=1428628 RepID=A0A1J4P2E5_9ACTN|nr:glycosyltransferase family 87 protein [Streptomyces mangrovisoli]OIJ68795.1 hypothetical protein WN71_006270 [Streptomyces mangrovisoli]